MTEICPIDSLLEKCEVFSLENPHPFSLIQNKKNILSEDEYFQKLTLMMSKFLATAQAFPYIQAGSQKDLIFRYIQNDEEVPKEVELTTIVANFLAWDETGGLPITLNLGMKGINKIFETERFHYNLLKKDIIRLFGHSIKPHHDEITKKYLQEKHDGFANPNHLIRTAVMAAFENNAEKMLIALWESLVEIFEEKKPSKLHYFMMHVGGSNPAEAHHVEITKNLIRQIVDESQYDEFMVHYKEAYNLHTGWCAAIAKDLI
tara:strand:- start:11928 stop:12710 length:783 start_codon:yes stop_codon:yes gene_type:complete